MPAFLLGLKGKLIIGGLILLALLFGYLRIRSGWIDEGIEREKRKQRDLLDRAVKERDKDAKDIRNRSDDDIDDELRKQRDLFS